MTSFKLHIYDVFVHIYDNNYSLIKETNIDSSLYIYSIKTKDINHPSGFNFIYDYKNLCKILELLNPTIRDFRSSI